MAKNGTNLHKVQDNASRRSHAKEQKSLKKVSKLLKMTKNCQKLLKLVKVTENHWKKQKVVESDGKLPKMTKIAPKRPKLAAKITKNRFGVSRRFFDSSEQKDHRAKSLAQTCWKLTSSMPCSHAHRQGESRTWPISQMSTRLVQSMLSFSSAHHWVTRDGQESAAPASLQANAQPLSILDQPRLQRPAAVRYPGSWGQDRSRHRCPCPRKDLEAHDRSLD